MPTALDAHDESGLTDMARSARLDPVTHEIIQGKLLAVVDEMAIVMTRTSMSPVIYEVLDFACGICNAQGELIAQTNGITLFTGTFAAQIRSVIERFGTSIRPGDAIATNDPFRGGTHACDVAIVRPIFAASRLIAFAINVAHWLDVGGSIPGSLSPVATSIFEEGLRLPCVKVVENDQLVESIVDIIRENVRFPDTAIGDLNAQLATVRIADQRMHEVIAQYGADTLQKSCEQLLHESEIRSREIIRSLPDGTYVATDVIDGDGINPLPFAVQVSVCIAGDNMEIDFTGCPPACAGPINCARGALHSAVKTVFKALVAPHDPSNEGWFRPLSIIAPQATLFTAERPSPTGWYYEGSVQASELVWRALARVVPDMVSAGSYTSLCVTYISGRDENGEPFVHIEPAHGGWGASREQDGAHALIALTDGDTYNYSIELIEAKFPLLVERYEFNVEGGVGAGRFRGGYGLVREYRVLAEHAEIYCGFGRTATRPWSMEGGDTGSVNSLEITKTSGERLKLGRSPARPVNKGDLVKIITGGGGGWGPPSDRDPAAVASDVRNELISANDARSIYGQQRHRLLGDSTT